MTMSKEMQWRGEGRSCGSAGAMCKELINVPNNNDDLKLKTAIVSYHFIYKFATNIHSKTVPYNCLRMTDVKYKFSPLNYKNVITSHFKMVPDNRLRTCVVKGMHFSLQ